MWLQILRGIEQYHNSMVSIAKDILTPHRAVHRLYLPVAIVGFLHRYNYISIEQPPLLRLCAEIP